MPTATALSNSIKTWMLLVCRWVNQFRDLRGQLLLPKDNQQLRVSWLLNWGGDYRSDVTQTGPHIPSLDLKAVLWNQRQRRRLMMHRHQVIIHPIYWSCLVSCSKLCIYLSPGASSRYTLFIRSCCVFALNPVCPCFMLLSVVAMRSGRPSALILLDFHERNSKKRVSSDANCPLACVSLSCHWYSAIKLGPVLKSKLDRWVHVLMTRTVWSHTLAFDCITELSYVSKLCPDDDITSGSEASNGNKRARTDDEYSLHMGYDKRVFLEQPLLRRLKARYSCLRKLKANQEVEYCVKFLSFEEGFYTLNFCILV